jgi:hypothetical protein
MMDEDEFEKERWSVDLDDPLDASNVNSDNPAVRVLDLRREELASPDASLMGRTRGGEAPGIDWVSASDLLRTSTARLAGRGLDFEVELARRMQRVPPATRRVIDRRADRLPPLSEFGRTANQPQFTSPDLGRR